MNANQLRSARLAKLTANLLATGAVKMACFDCGVATTSVDGHVVRCVACIKTNAAKKVVAK